jgi:hypothetical protein
LGYDFSRLPSKKISLIDEKVELTAHSSGLDDHDAQAATIFKQHGTRSSKTMPIFGADPVAESSSRTCGTTVKKQEQNRAEEDEGINKSDEGEDDLGLSDRARINSKKKAVPSDTGSETLNTEVMPVVLTAREGTVELGWKVWGRVGGHNLRDSAIGKLYTRNPIEPRRSVIDASMLSSAMLAYSRPTTHRSYLLHLCIHNNVLPYLSRLPFPLAPELPP